MRKEKGIRREDKATETTDKGNGREMRRKEKQNRHKRSDREWEGTRKVGVISDAVWSETSGVVSCRRSGS